MLAQAAIVGLPVSRLLDGSHSEVLILEAAAARAWALLGELQRAQATLIANAMVKARIGAG